MVSLDLVRSNLGSGYYHKIGTEAVVASVFEMVVVVVFRVVGALRLRE